MEDGGIFSIGKHLADIRTACLLCGCRWIDVYKRQLLDRFLVTMDLKDIPVILCFNKRDIAQDREAAELKEVYEACGYPVLFTSAKEKENIGPVSYTHLVMK